MKRNSQFFGLAVLILSLLLLAGCNPAEPAAPTHTLPPSPPAAVAPSETPAPSQTPPARELLTYAQLFGGFDPGSPVDELALAIPENAALPAYQFEGRLELTAEATTGQQTMLKGDLSDAPESAYLPEFDHEFVQEGSYLVPVQRGLLISDHPYWNLMLEPGRVWQEPGDQGFSRASFPFALVWKGSNAVFNGTMTFLFDEDEVSQVWYQVTQETSISLSLDLWGLVPASYHPGPVENAKEVRQSFQDELENLFPTRPIEQLADDYPDLGIDLAAFGDGVTPKNMTWYGFVVDGVNYVGGCQTRYGAYPYCEYLRAPSYSTAKSAFVSVALMRLAQKYDPALPDLLIKDFVPEAADSAGDWSQVTFNNTLDMATGNYRSAEFMADDESWDSDPFWSATYYNDLIAAAFGAPQRADPGTRWVYRTADTFILTAALQNYLESVQGADADIYDFVVAEVYQPLKMEPGVFSVMRTQDDNWQGQPYGGMGQWWVPDDLAKITTLLNVDHGVIAGEQVLHPDILAAALQQNPDDRGVIIGTNFKYNNAFWANFYPESRGYGCGFWVTEMQGYSGIVVALFPNGTSYYYASDGREFTWDAALRESSKIVPLCKP